MCCDGNKVCGRLLQVCVCGDDGWLPVRGVLVTMVGSVVAFGDDNLCVM